MTREYKYDNAGNLLEDGRAVYGYDAFNRCTKVETFDGNVQINRYDAEGLRHEMEENGELVSFIFRGREVVAEESQKGKIRYIRTGELLASDAEYARTYYHYASDEMGSITHVVAGLGKEAAVTEQDSGPALTGEWKEPVLTEQGNEPAERVKVPENSILNRYEYDAWGNLTVCEETVGNRFRFNGQQYDPVSQQYYLRARYYNPVIGRFTQEDTCRGDGLNLYVYCRNNPVCYVDPSGHMTCEEARKTMQNAIRDSLTIQTMDASIVSSLQAWYENKRGRGWLSDEEVELARQVGLMEDRPIVTGTYDDLVSNGHKDAHHIIQDAAVRDIPGYNRMEAPAIQLQGPSNVVGTDHYYATLIQRREGGGTYGAERGIAYMALRKAGLTVDEAKAVVRAADNYFMGQLGLSLDSPTRIPGNRRR